MKNIKQTYVRLPEKLKQQLLAIAEEENWTMNQTLQEAAKLLIAAKKPES